MKTIDITPTWSAILPMTLEVYKQYIKKLTNCRSKLPQVEQAAKEIESELKKMALAADNWNEHIKQLKKAKSN